MYIQPTVEELRSQVIALRNHYLSAFGTLSTSELKDLIKQDCPTTASSVVWNRALREVLEFGYGAVR